MQSHFHGGMCLFSSPGMPACNKICKGCNINALFLIIAWHLASFPAALRGWPTTICCSSFEPARIFADQPEADYAAALLALKGLLPAAAVLSPWTDLMLTGKSIKPIRKFVFSRWMCRKCEPDVLRNNDGNPLISLYAAAPRIAPLHIGAERDSLDDSIKFADKARAACYRYLKS
jgi:hypothetical protein